MKLKEAFSRLRYTISKQNKPNQTDAVAFNEISKYFELHQKDIVQDNLLFAKLYAFTLSLETDAEIAIPIKNDLRDLALPIIDRILPKVPIIALSILRATSGAGIISFALISYCDSFWLKSTVGSDF